jgi:hypothetical protein
MARHPTQYGTTKAAVNLGDLHKQAQAERTWLTSLLQGIMLGDRMQATDVAAPPAQTTAQQTTAELISLVMAEMMKKLSNPRRVRPLQEFMARHLHASRVPQNVHTMLSRLLLAQTRQTFSRSKGKVVDDELCEDVDLEFEPQSLRCVLYDNLGFKILGAEPGYLQVLPRHPRSSYLGRIHH